jgi:hypothetical protein
MASEDSTISLVISVLQRTDQETKVLCENLCRSKARTTELQNISLQQRELIDQLLLENKKVKMEKKGLGKLLLKVQFCLLTGHPQRRCWNGSKKYKT